MSDSCKPDLWLTIAIVVYIASVTGWTAYFIIKFWGMAA
jgi:hypothetical protein